MGFAVVFKGEEKQQVQAATQTDSRAQQQTTTRRHSTTGHNTGEQGTKTSHTKPHGTDHAARQKQRHRSMPPGDNSDQPDPTASTLKHQAATHSTSQCRRGKGAPRRKKRHMYRSTAQHSTAQEAPRNTAQRKTAQHIAGSTAGQYSTAPKRDNDNVPQQQTKQGETEAPQRNKHHSREQLDTPRQDTAPHGTAQQKTAGERNATQPRQTARRT